MKTTLRALALAALLAPGLAAHEGHKEAGTFEPPNGGAFGRLSDHWVEFYLDGAKAWLCMYEPDGALTVDQHAPRKIALKLSGKGLKARTLTAAATEKGCVSWDFKSDAKLIRAELSALVDGQPAKARLSYENKPRPKTKLK